MLRASVSKIKQFYNFEQGLYGITHQAVVNTIKGVYTVSKQKESGILIDALLMDRLGNTNTYEKISKEIGRQLPEESVNVLATWAEDFKKTNEHIATQIDNTKTYDTILGPLTVSMRLDVLTPHIVYDIKSSAYHLDAFTYYNDVQGAFYTNAYEVDQMGYEHFWISPRTMDVKYDGNVFVGYSDDKYCIDLLNRFLGFCTRNGLVNYLKKCMHLRIAKSKTEYFVMDIDDHHGSWYISKQGIHIMHSNHKDPGAVIKYFDWIAKSIFENTGIVCSTKINGLIVPTRDLDGFITIK